MPEMKALKVPLVMSDDFKALESTMREMFDLMSQECKCMKKAASLMSKIENAAMKRVSKSKS